MRTPASVVVLLVLLLCVAPAPAPAAEPAPGPGEPVSFYELGTQARQRGDHLAAKAAFLQMLQNSPQSGGALEGLALACLSLGQYDEARTYLERWNLLSPKSSYILGILARAERGLRDYEGVRGAYLEIVSTAPCDLVTRRRLDDLMYDREPGLFPRGRIRKSLVTEELNTANPQRIVYEGRSGQTRARARVGPKVDLIGGAEVSQDAQRNDTGGFTYYDILEQVYSFGAQARPDRNSLLEAEYGQSLLSDNKGLGVGRTDFSRARFHGELRALDSDFRLTATRAPKFLRGAGGSRFFAILRESGARAEAEGYRFGWGLLGRAGVYGYSDRTTFRTWSLQGSKEFGDNLLQPSYSRGQQEFFGASPDGRLAAVDYDAWGLRFRRRVEEVYQIGASCAYSQYHDANRLGDYSAELTAWLPWHQDPCGGKDLSVGYRYAQLDYRTSAVSYRSTTEIDNWIGAYWRRGCKEGAWPMLGYEHGFIRDSRGPYQGNAYLGELEFYHRGNSALTAQGRLGRDTVRDDSYSLGLQARYSFE